MDRDGTVSDIIGNWFAHTVQWGNAQELITWVVAGVALLFARRAALAAGRTNDLQSEQLQALRDDQLKREEEDRRRQAEMIAVWCDIQREGLLVATNMDGPERVVRVRNSSELPVYIPVVYVTSPIDGIIELFEPDIPIPPARSARVFVLRQFRNVPRENQSAPLAAGVMFRDARNQYWRRDTFGILEPRSENEFFEEIDSLRDRYSDAVRRPNQFDD